MLGTCSSSAYPRPEPRFPASPDWLHEIKFDGYRLRVERNGDRVRLITRGGYDWKKRYPWIVEAALKNRQKQFVIDGEAVILGVDGYSDFNALHSGKHNDEVQLCAFDVLAMDGDDLRDLPLCGDRPLSAAKGSPSCREMEGSSRGSLVSIPNTSVSTRGL
jgi:ATP-dependent DNA ligase